ncbi:N-6 DNA methylase [Aquimarina pacifica]|uniref:N-6 DNA methylase n=1 Tax=Aquimarina pacifica TaxID=1296415 RepID=UPI00046F2F68|nr:N-6 DNA methylase [Aquimarina pacifica]
MTTLENFNDSLNKIRLSLHKYGKINDANAKLDEVSKLLAIKLFDLKKDKKRMLPKLLKNYESKSKESFVTELQILFQDISNDIMFKDSNKNSIFGNNPRLEIDTDDYEFAYSIIKMLDVSLNDIMIKGEEFDLINETFGHFIRSNFRNNIEDAQYMTPQEVVDLVCKIAASNFPEISNSKEFLVCDPCCGVGSFLTTFYRNNKKERKIKVIGQDKVQRMVRLSKLNMELFDSKNHFISKGNSLIEDSDIDKFKGKIDLIITNPPFGASFNGKELQREEKEKYPLLFDTFRNSTNINSEILFIDRCIGLLKEGGELLAVVPDSVISSKGIAETLRFRIMSDPDIHLKSVIELPTVTFAQAGTRTKTSILHLKKTKHKSTVKNRGVFIAKSTSLGFEVSIRKGATVKIKKGYNDLIDISKSYTTEYNEKFDSEPKIISDSPSCVIVKEENFSTNAWTPSHYDASIYKAIQSLKKKSDVALVPLKDLVEFVTIDRKKEIIKENAKCISILHIVNGDILDYKELMKYTPKYPGVTCKPDDLIFSKINPRIPRALVVPDLKIPLTCSSEFEIINSKCEINNYGIKTLLMLPPVQTQINHLTSGTSSSHNRIKTKELMEVLVPIPSKKSKEYSVFIALLEKSEKEHKSMNKLAVNRVKLMEALSEVF